MKNKETQIKLIKIHAFLRKLLFYLKKKRFIILFKKKEKNFIHLMKIK